MSQFASTTAGLQGLFNLVWWFVLLRKFKSTENEEQHVLLNSTNRQSSSVDFFHRRGWTWRVTDLN